MEERGIVSFWNDEKGFGFINPLHGGERIFLHAKGIRSYERPLGGELVCYSLETDEEGRMRATNVRFVTGNPPVVAPPRSVLALGIAGGSIVILGLCLARGHLHPLGFLYYLAVSLVAFVAFWFDKRKAEAHHWRTSEATLYLLSIAGGWPGAILAQQIFRHKVRKSGFMAGFWLCAVLNAVALALLISPLGSSILASPGRSPN